MTDLAPAATVRRPTRTTSPIKRWWRRRPINRAMVLAHRWPALILGLFLVIECTTGAVLLYHGEYFRATNSNLYQHTDSADPITPDQAIDIVAEAHPKFGATWVAKDAGVYAVGEPTYERQWFVDPGTGHLNGEAGQSGGFMGLMVQVHDCAFTCEGYPLYSSWLAKPIWTDGPTWLTGITWAGVIMGVLGVLMILLALTSLKIWWPGVKRLRQRFSVRRGKGRFARDYDLHNVIGAVALPFVLMWGITGAAFEFPGIEKAWIAITGGEQTPEPTYTVTPNPAAAKNPQLTAAQAVDVALAKVPGTLNFLGRPTKDAPYWEVDVETDYASSAHRVIYSGDAFVYIDAHDAGNLAVFDDGTGPAANRFYDKFLEPTHFGWNVNPWWRIIWFVLGLAPLALMVTGVSTWLYRRGITKRRRQAGKNALPETALEPDRLDRAGEHDLADIDPADIDPAEPEYDAVGVDAERAPVQRS